MKRLLALALLPLLSPTLGAAPEPKVILDYADAGYARLDPARARAADGDQRLLEALFDMLTRLDPATGRALPAAAERFEPAPDGRSWTFTLRGDATWTDGKPVVAKDFVRGWRRVLDPDPDQPSPWRTLFRPIRGASEILDHDFARRVLDAFQRGLTDALESKKDGLPGRDLRDLVEEVGLKAVPGIAEQPVLRRMLKWGDDKFTAEKLKEVLEAIKSERRKHKTPTFDTFDAFGTSLGAIAKDDRTLVVETVGWVPALPELLARPAFAPFPEAMAETKDVGEIPSSFVTNGPFRLLRRGSKPPREGAATPSTVHLVRNPDYKGTPAKVDEIRCWTDEGVSEEIRRFKTRELQWITAPDPEARKELEALAGYRTRPTGTLVALRFRCDGPPFDKAEVRRAFGALVDRAALAKLLWPAADPADRLVPPRVRGAQTGVRVKAVDGSAVKGLLQAAGLDGAKLEKLLADHSLLYHEGLDAPAGRLVGTWEKQLGLSPGHLSYTGDELARFLRTGSFRFALTRLSGAYDDPLAYLSVFSAASPDGGLGWKDEAFEALLAGAQDPDAAGRAPAALEPFLASSEAKSRLAAHAGGPTAASRAALRGALLAEAEQRLLDEAVVVPVMVLRAADVLGPLKGLGEEAAWANGTFLGSLRDVSR